MKRPFRSYKTTRLQILTMRPWGPGEPRSPFCPGIPCKVEHRTVNANQ